MAVCLPSCQMELTLAQNPIVNGQTITASANLTRIRHHPVDRVVFTTTGPIVANPGYVPTNADIPPNPIYNWGNGTYTTQITATGVGPATISALGYRSNTPACSDTKYINIESMNRTCLVNPSDLSQFQISDRRFRISRQSMDAGNMG